MDEGFRRNSIAKSIRETFPRVSEVRINLRFHEDGPVAPPDSEKMITKKPQHKAVFFEQCRMRECVGGGHDLDAVIKEMINNEEPRRVGEMSCVGWQDADRGTGIDAGISLPTRSKSQ